MYLQICGGKYSMNMNNFADYIGVKKLIFIMKSCVSIYSYNILL